MKYVCDLWYEANGNGHVTPYGEFFFENDKYPEPFEVGRKITEELSFLQEDYIEEKGLSHATPGGEKPEHSHYCCVNFTVNGRTNYLYFTSLRPVAEDKKPDEMNLYT